MVEFPFSQDYLAVLGGAEEGKTSGKRSGKIVDLIRGNRFITIPELAEQVSITERSVERYLHRLQKQGIIRRVGAAKGGHWEVH